MSINVKEIERRIEQASTVIITAHKNLDLDALGSMLGFYYIAKSFNKDTMLLIEESNYEAGVSKIMDILKNDDLGIKITDSNNIENKVNNTTLLVVLDTHIETMLQCPRLVQRIKNIMVFDHHVVDDSLIKNEFQYINEKMSSVSELVAKIIKKMKIQIPDLVATTMLAGMFVDTNSFLYKTSFQTHQIAAYLLKQHASIEGVQYVLKEDFEKYEIRQRIIKTSEWITQKYVIAISDSSHLIRSEDLAKISNELLLFNGVEASFTIGVIDGKVCVSARSLGKVDVEQLMKQLGGGGHKSDAGVQLVGTTIEEVKKKIMASIQQ